MVKLSSGAVAAVNVAPESKIPTISNTSARPKEIISSSGRVPNASVVPVVTFNCFISLVVLDFTGTEVLSTDAVSLTFALFPRRVLSVMVKLFVPDPLVLSVRSITSPATALPPPALITVSV